MSRSRRKTPIAGITTAESDAEWKRKAARRLRRHAKTALTIDPLSFALAGKRWDVVNPWDAPKDGKIWFTNQPDHVMRK